MVAVFGQDSTGAYVTVFDNRIISTKIDLELLEMRLFDYRRKYGIDMWVYSRAAEMEIERCLFFGFGFDAVASCTLRNAGHQKNEMAIQMRWDYPDTENRHHR